MLKKKKKKTPGQDPYQKNPTTKVSSKMEEKRLIQRHYHDNKPKGIFCRGKKEHFEQRIKNQNSSEQHWKPENNGALPWKYKGNFGKRNTAEI